MRDALVSRYEQPGDDMLSELVHAQVDRDGKFNLPYLVTICTELLSGGVVTTAQMMVNAMLLLLEHPDQMAKVRCRLLADSMDVRGDASVRVAGAVADSRLRQ